jgi:hypothetical protein
VVRHIWPHSTAPTLDSAVAHCWLPRPDSSAASCCRAWSAP